MLDRLILDKVDQISYNQGELSRIATSSNYLRSIINGRDDFNHSFIGGSYIRHTMVKNVSDVDIYYQYVGGHSAQTALQHLRNYLIYSYPRTQIRQDRPSILINFNSLPFNITPYTENWGQRLIPSTDLITWQPINMITLENNIQQLRNRNRRYISLIKILKLWNHNNNGGFRNYRIEEIVCAQRLFGIDFQTSISNWMYDFFLNTGLTQVANQMHQLIMDDNNNAQNLTRNWNNFIS